MTITLKAADAATANGFKDMLDIKLANLSSTGSTNIVLADWIALIDEWPKEVKDAIRQMITDVGVTIDINGLNSTDKTDLKAKIQIIRDEWATKAMAGVQIDPALIAKLFVVIKK